MDNDTISNDELSVNIFFFLSCFIASHLQLINIENGCDQSSVGNKRQQMFISDPWPCVDFIYIQLIFIKQRLVERRRLEMTECDAFRGLEL